MIRNRMVAFCWVRVSSDGVPDATISPCAMIATLLPAAARKQHAQVLAVAGRDGLRQRSGNAPGGDRAVARVARLRSMGVPDEAALSSFVTHLESALDGTTLPADTVQTTHRDRPLWVRYDLDAIGRLHRVGRQRRSVVAHS